MCALYVYHIDTEKEGKAARGGGTALDGADTEVQAVRVLDDEAGEDARERAKHGGSWNRPESAQLAAPMRERLETYRQNLTQAEESDRSLAGRVGESAAMLSHLHADRVGMLLPPLQVRVCVCVCVCG